MKKRFLPMLLLLACAVALPAQETVTLTFTATTQDGAFCPMETVEVTNLTRGWTETLYYPDTVLTLTSMVGVAENGFGDGNLSEVYPNPFEGRTHAVLNLKKDGHVRLEVVYLDGKTGASCEADLDAGSHRVSVSLGHSGVAFLVVTTAQGREVMKLVNTGNGGTDALAVDGQEAKPSKAHSRGRAEAGAFEPGDMMRYVAGRTEGGTTVYSEITQPQYTDETIAFVFASSATENGLFSVGGGKRVCFSSGNLQYQASTRTWRFAANQYDYVGGGNANVSENHDGWIDLFGWGTSGHDHGAVGYQPWSVSQNNADYYAYGQPEYNLNDQSGQADWGSNAISNGGDTPNVWRTLTQAEWNYVLNERLTANGFRYAKAEVHGFRGVILLPDDWDETTFGLNNTNSAMASFNSNIIDASQWETLETSGVVFLPAAGYRYGNEVFSVGTWGDYWTATRDSGDYAFGVFFGDWDLGANSTVYRFGGRAVRLVRDVE